MDKSQRTEKHVEQRAEIPDQYPLNFPPAFYGFNTQCVIDQHGDDLLDERVICSQSNNGKIIFDRFQISLNCKVLQYSDKPDANKAPGTIGSLDNKWIQCQYDWRYNEYEGGFYYWLYEEVTLNAISLKTLNQNVLLNSDPVTVFTG